MIIWKSSEERERKRERKKKKKKKKESEKERKRKNVFLVFFFQIKYQLKIYVVYIAPFRRDFGSMSNEQNRWTAVRKKPNSSPKDQKGRTAVQKKLVPGPTTSRVPYSLTSNLPANLPPAGRRPEPLLVVTNLPFSLPSFFLWPIILLLESLLEGPLASSRVATSSR